MLTTRQIVNRLNARVLSPGPESSVEIDHVYFSDKMSRLLAEADERTLLVSHLNHAQLVRAAALVDAPALCLLDDAIPDGTLVEAARAHRKILLVSPWGLDATLRRLSGGEITLRNGEAE